MWFPGKELGGTTLAALGSLRAKQMLNSILTFHFVFFFFFWKKQTFSSDFFP